ncbi:hypothetical protein PMAYCL1PPCAC_23078, partial [Pristionchus mayeri]
MDVRKEDQPSNPTLFQINSHCNYPVYPFALLFSDDSTAGHPAYGTPPRVRISYSNMPNDHLKI